MPPPPAINSKACPAPQQQHVATKPQRWAKDYLHNCYMSKRVYHLHPCQLQLEVAGSAGPVPPQLRPHNQALVAHTALTAAAAAAIACRAAKTSVSMLCADTEPAHWQACGIGVVEPPAHIGRV